MIASVSLIRDLCIDKLNGTGKSPISAAKDFLRKLIRNKEQLAKAERNTSNWATAAFGLAKHCKEVTRWYRLGKARSWSPQQTIADKVAVAVRVGVRVRVWIRVRARVPWGIGGRARVRVCYDTF